MLAVSPEQRAEQFVGLGMTPGAARACVAGSGPEMGRCILELYRSAPESAMAATGRTFAAAAHPPCGVVIATEDHYTGGEALARRMAERWAADIAVLEGLGHWWMLQDPVRGAAAIDALLPR